MYPISSAQCLSFAEKPQESLFVKNHIVYGKIAQIRARNWKISNQIIEIFLPNFQNDMKLAKKTESRDQISPNLEFRVFLLQQMPN